MALERTLSIVKPDGVGRNLIGDVYRRDPKHKKDALYASSSRRDCASWPPVCCT